MKQTTEKGNDAWKMLLESVEEKDMQIRRFQEREIEFLQLLLKKDDEVKSLIKIISDLKFPKNKANTEYSGASQQKAP